MERVRFVMLIGIGETVLGPTPARVEDLPGRLGMMETPPGATFQSWVIVEMLLMMVGGWGIHLRRSKTSGTQISLGNLRLTTTSQQSGS